MNAAENGRRFESRSQFIESMSARLSRLRILFLVGCFLAGAYGPTGAWW